MTAKLQPLDQDIIKSYKVGYRRRLLDRLLLNVRMGTELKVDLLGAIQMLTGAWRDVKTHAVANCFRKAGFGTAELAETGTDRSDYATISMSGHLNRCRSSKWRGDRGGCHRQPREGRGREQVS
ncbi:uncharacterized protein LOC144139634 [Haemaphysalis longicornis]